MPQIKPNALTVKAKLKERGNFTIEKHPGLWLASRGDGNGSWRVRYRPPGEKLQRWHTLSNDARNADFDDIVRVKDQWLGRVKHDGVDPKAEQEAALAAKQAAEAAAKMAATNTFDSVVAGWTAWQEANGIRSAQQNRRQYELHVKSALGARDATTITRRDVVALLGDVGIKAGKIQANRIQSLLSAAFQWAIDEGRIESHPASRIRKQAKENARDRAATDDEIIAIWKASFTLAPQIGRVIRLLMLTGQRRTEVCQCPLSELRGDEWIIPEPRLKNKQPFHIVPLPKAARKEFDDAIAESAGSPYVFQARKIMPSPMNPTTPSAAFADLMRELKIEDFRLHDLRHVCATGMASLGVPPDIREMVQNQITGRRRTMGGRYDQHTYTTEKRRALELWAARLLEIVEGRPPSGVRW
jgi:integrase